MPATEHTSLSAAQVEHFIDAGFVKLEDAFSADLAQRCRDELWTDIGLSPDRPDDWTQPVIRVGFKTSSPFLEAANTPRLRGAYDGLVGGGHRSVRCQARNRATASGSPREDANPRPRSSSGTLRSSQARIS